MNNKPTIWTNIHLHNDTSFNLDVYPIEGMDSSVLNITFNEPYGTGFKFFFNATPQEVVLTLTNILRELKRKHGVVSSDEYDGITETNAILDDPEAMEAINEGIADLNDGQLQDYADQFNSSPLGQAINSIFNITKTQEV